MGGTSMTGRVTRFLATRRRELVLDGLEFAYVEEQPGDTSVGDVEFEFLDDGDMLLAQSASSDERHSNEMELDQEENEGDKDHCGNIEENRSFWENQHQLLQVILINTFFILINSSYIIS